MRLGSVIALALTLGGSAACAAQQRTARQPNPAASVRSTSPLCESLQGHFIGLPAKLKAADKAGAPAAGRWWVRSCAFDLAGGELHLRLGGPGWYWVDRREGSFHLRQPVYFHVEADVYGSIQKRIGWKNGVISVWFKPSRAVVHATPLGRMHPSSRNPAVSVLRRLVAPLPGMDVDDRVRKLVEQELTKRFSHGLGRDYTVVYDLERFQPDFAIGALKEGARPEHPLHGAGRFYVNEALLATPGGLHAFGPFDPEEALRLDASISSGSGVAWRAICAADVERAFTSMESGKAVSIPKRAVLEGGKLSGSGLRHAKTSAAACESYIVVSSIGDDVTRAALRVRPL